jgi:hypothetical protein
MFILCLSILGIALMAQAALTQNEDVTHASDDGSVTLTTSFIVTAAEEGSLSEVKEIFIPQSLITAIICLVDGFVLCCISDMVPKTKQFLISFSAGTIEIYIFCIFAVPFDGGEADSVKKIVYVAVSGGVGLLLGLLSICCPIADAVMAGSFGCFVGVAATLLLKPDTKFVNPAENIAFRVFLFVAPTAASALASHYHGPHGTLMFKGFAGSFALLLGVDFFIKTGFTSQLEAYLDFNSDADSSSSTESDVMWGVAIGLGLLGGMAKAGLYIAQLENDDISSTSSKAIRSRDSIGITIFFYYLVICLVVGLCA